MVIDKKSEIAAQNYAELKRMLKSQDKASVNLALVTLEQSDFAASEIYILCLLKECYSEILSFDKNFETEFATLFANIKASFSEEGKIDIVSLSYETIFKKCQKRKNEEELKFILDIFSDELKSILKEFGFEFLNYLDLYLVPKTAKVTIDYYE